MNLPEAYVQAMKALLGEEYEAYLESFSAPVFRGMRINRMKVDPKTCQELAGKALRPVPWVENGYFYEDADQPARHPHYYAGLYYLQEPSAMTPASRLPVSPGDRVLDLCAAPGGKATELGACLAGEGVLLANDISHSRAKALLKNLELFGIPNLFVTSEDPARLAVYYEGWFDKVLIDAPCSGEGMFRREHSMIGFWEEKGPAAYVPVQRELLEQGVRMLKTGGMLLYSTCTFSPEEDELQILGLLERHPELTTVPVTPYEGFCPGLYGLADAVRIFPHKMEGEGHFLVLLKKQAGVPGQSGNADGVTTPGLPEGRISCASNADFPKNKKKKGEKLPGQERRMLLSKEQLPPCAEAFLSCIKGDRLFGQADAGTGKKGGFLIEGEQLYYLGPDMERKAHVRYLRTGLLVGSIKKDRFEPSQALAMALQKAEFAAVLDYKGRDPDVIRYLKGETVMLPAHTEGTKLQAASGWILVCVDGFPLGWGKAAGGRLKNKYQAGWRMQ